MVESKIVSHGVVEEDLHDLVPRIARDDWNPSATSRVTIVTVECSTIHEAKFVKLAA